MRRWMSVLVALVILSAIAAAPASAVTVQRTWSGPVGTNGANGRTTLQALADGTGLLSLNLKAVRANTAYQVEIRAGTCAKLGSVLTTLFPATSSPTGTVVTTRNLPSGKMNAVWGPARKGSIAFRLVHATGTKCGNLAFTRATRVQISSLGINLAVIAGSSSYPKCNVAMYLQTLWQPREPGVTFLYAHARRGMFLPLLTRSKTNNGASMIGMTVKVYTSDSKVHTYKIDKVRRHVTSVGGALGVTSERLWLQTSEGPNYRYPKLIVEAKRVSTGNTTYAASHPTARPVTC
jgi:hypothetical protein